MIAKNLVSGVLVSSISASATSFNVSVGSASAVTLSGFVPSDSYITVMPANPSVGVPNSLDSEVMLVTATSVGGENDEIVLTVTRAQKNTTAKAFSAGDIFTLGVYADDAVFLSSDGTSVTASPWISASDIIWSSVIDKIYPVGSIFMSATLSTASAVASALGGTWVAWGAGRVPVGVDTSQSEFDTAEETGGSMTHLHSSDGMEALIGSPSLNPNALGFNASSSLDLGSTYPSSYSVGNASTAYASGHPNRAHNTRVLGDTTSTSTLQPYITCYMFKRTA